MKRNFNRKYGFEGGESSLRVYCILGDFQSIRKSLGCPPQYNPEFGVQSGNWAILYPRISPYFVVSGDMEKTALTLSAQFETEVIGILPVDAGNYIEYVQCDHGKLLTSMRYIGECMAGKPYEPIPKEVMERIVNDDNCPGDVGIRIYYRYIDTRVDIDYCTDRPAYDKLNDLMSHKEIYIPNF